MASSGPLFPSTVVDDASVGSTAWSNPGNATAEDATSVTAAAGGGGSHYLKATGFGFTIPTGATIDGIVVEVKRAASTAFAATDSSVKTVKGGVIGGNDNAASALLPTSLTWMSFGSSTDLWGRAWTPADINASNFGAVYACFNNSGTVSVDAIRITVYYTVMITSSSASSADSVSVSASATRVLGRIVTVAATVAVGSDAAVRSAISAHRTAADFVPLIADTAYVTGGGGTHIGPPRPIVPMIPPVRTLLPDQFVALFRPWLKDSPDLEAFVRTIGEMFDPLGQYFEDGQDGTPGWGALLDPDLCPGPWPGENPPGSSLKFLAQWVGERLPAGISESDARQWIKDTPNQVRGTKWSIARVAQATLLGSKTVLIHPRHMLDGTPDADYVTVLTNDNETPDPDLTRANLLRQAVPADIVLNYDHPVGVTWGEVETLGTWADVTGEGTWADVATGVPRTGGGWFVYTKDSVPPWV